MTQRILYRFAFALAGLLALGSLNAFAADPDFTVLNITLLDRDGTGLVTRSILFENKIAYLRVKNVDAGLNEAIGTAWSLFSSSTNLIGVVLDLRYADGANSSAAQTAANLIEEKKLPLTILVNGETRGEAVSLATALRKSKEGLVFGSTMDGITTGPLKPDIAVKVSPEDERVYFANAFKVISRTSVSGADGGSTNDPSTSAVSAQRDRINEAELVRQRLKDTGQDSIDVPARPVVPQAPVVRDPVLARAMDLLKGLAIVREAKL